MAYQHGALKQFQGRQFAKGHRPTNYSRWAAEDQPYRIQYVKVGESAIANGRDLGTLATQPAAYLLVTAGKDRLIVIATALQNEAAAAMLGSWALWSLQ